MALSDQLAKLSVQTKHLEDSAKAASEKDRAALAKREGEVKTSLEQTRARAEVVADDGADEVEAGWRKLQQSVSDGFAGLRESADRRRVEFKAKHADRKADNAEKDAEDAVAFAIYSIEQAEYYVVAAAQARLAADEADLNAGRAPA